MAKGNRNGAEREMVRQIVWLFQCLPCNFLVYLKSCINANVTKTCIKSQFKYPVLYRRPDYLLLYEQNWLKEGTEALVLKKTAASSK